MRKEQLTPEEEEQLVKLAEDPVADGPSDAATFIQKQGWRPGRKIGPRVSSLFYYYRMHGGKDSGHTFCRTLTALGFRRKRNNGSCLLLHSEDARVLRQWTESNPTPEAIKLAANCRSRPSQRRLFKEENLSLPSSNPPTETTQE